MINDIPADHSNKKIKINNKYTKNNCNMEEFNVRYSILFFEFSLNLETKKYKKQFKRASDNFQISPTDYGYANKSFISNRIGIKYYDESKKKKIKITVYPGLVIGDDDLTKLWKPSSKNIEKLQENLDSFIESYFFSDYTINDFNLTRVDYAVDIDVGSRDKVSDYIKVLNSIGRIKCFSPIKRSKHGDDRDKFGLNGNTNGVEFRAHGLKQDKKILRVEVRLTKKDTIRAYSGETDTSGQIKEMAENREHIFMDSFLYIVPRGDHFKLKEAKKIVYESVTDRKLRNSMIFLLELVPQKRSLLLAFKSLKTRNLPDIRAAFEDINVSILSLPKRNNNNKLDSLYSFLTD